MRVKMAATGTGSWIKFFKDAGLPSSAAATYALTFTENRIRMDMLLDLNKEILKDMRINLMGDVIAILRHARRVHEQTAREKVLAGSPSVPSPAVKTAATVAGRSSPTDSSDSGNSSPNITIGDSTPKQQRTAASRMVHHYVRPADATGPLPDKNLKDEVPGLKTAKVIPGVKRKVKPKVAGPPVKKVRRVLPEHEGRYKITMPSGSTPRTQEILAKQGLMPAKKTVFERLGEGSVSSTTGTDGPLITITGLGTKIIKNNTDKFSVFSRLGDKQRIISSTTPDLDEEDREGEDDDDEEPSPYAGVFKLHPSKALLTKKVPVTQKTAEEATMRADAESSSVIEKKVLLHSRLGSGTTVSRVVKRGGMLSTVVKPVKVVKKVKNKTAGILANPTNATKLSVKARLGSSSDGSPALSTVAVKRKPEPNTASSAPIKSVSFGTVTQKVYQKEPLHPRITVGTVMKRTSVFGRLGT